MASPTQVITFQFVPELTKEAYVTNELESKVTNSHCEQASGLAVQESYGGMSSVPGVIPSRVRE